ncbi:MAG: amidophosphoribosyltransferase, partial [Deltaproteobacteria bacterium]|nr:amidophosphoribosyltransferase [Deltaproteobacteria bacterium]
IKMVREAGAKEVHFRISSPPTQWPCFYGIDTPNRNELIAATHSIDEIKKYITCDSLEYLSPERLYWFQKNKPEGFCDACFTGKFPVELQDFQNAQKKQVKE